jgi:uncharacterized protein (DUF3084 family)
MVPGGSQLLTEIRVPRISPTRKWRARMVTIVAPTYVSVSNTVFIYSSYYSGFPGNLKQKIVSALVFLYFTSLI